MQKEPTVGSIALLCLLTTPLISGLLLHSLYLVYRDITTNESGKWYRFQLDIGRGLVSRRPLLQNRQRDSRTEPDVPSWQKRSSFIYFRANKEPLSAATESLGQSSWLRDFTLR